MKKYIWNVLLATVTLCVLESCDRENPLDREQYMKQVYMVGAYDGVMPFNVTYSGDQQEAYVSVAVSGTMFPDHDVKVTLKHSDDAIQAYNNKYMLDNAPVKYQKLDDTHYSMPTMSGIIKANEVYARIPFAVMTEGLHCDSLYALGFEIESADYPSNELTPTLILNIQLDNDYSGNYELAARKSTVTLVSEDPEEATLSETSTVSATRIVKAVDEKSVRIFHEAQPESRSGYDNNEKYWEGLKNYGVVFTRINETNEFEIMNWYKYSTNGEKTDGLNIVAGKATYEDNVFTFWYDFMESNKRKRVYGTLTK